MKKLTVMKKTLLLILAHCFLAACAWQTDVPSLAREDVPVEWMGPVEEEAEVWPELDWWNSFNDEELTEIIELVQVNNLDLANNRRNLRSAQIALREAGFDLLPSPAVDIGRRVTYSDGNGSGVATSRDSGTFDGSGSFDGSGTSSSPLELGVSLTYNNILSKPVTYDRAVAEYESRAAQVADVALNTLGTAASTYFQVLLARDRITATRQNVENAEAISDIARARVEAGVAVPIEALQQELALERERANLRSLVQEELAARSALALLTGQTIQGFDVDGLTLQAIELPAVQPGLPSELLMRRPDLVQQEANLRSAAANVDIVRTRFFPQISLTGSSNASSPALTQFISSPDTFLTLNASLVQTLITNGQRRRDLEQARLTLENSLADYRKAVLTAFNEVDVQLNNIQVLEQLREVAEQNLATAEESFRIAQARFQEGVADFQTVLRAQNDLFSSRIAVLDNKLRQLNARVALYQALGGGWQADEL